MLNSAPSLGPAQRITIDFAERSYDILIGESLLSDPASYEGLKGHSALIVSTTTVAPLYAAHLKAALGTRHAQLFEVVLPDGEVYKTWETLNLIFDALLAHPLNLWVDEHQRFVAVFRDVNHHQALVHIDLRRGQANAIGVVHGLQHVGDEGLDACIHRSHRFGDGMQARIGVFQYV